MNEFKSRRNKLAALMRNESIMLLPGAKHQHRNGDVEYPFRQNSDFYYLTGFIEADAVMALTKDHKGNVVYMLFNLPHDPVAEVWQGKRVGQQAACKQFDVDEAYDIASIDEVLPKLFANKQAIYYPLATNKEFDLKILNWLNLARGLLRSKANSEVSFVPDALIDVLPLIHELRLFKSESEIANMRKAAEISAEAHIKLMQACKPGQMEYQLEAIFNSYCLQAGCRGLAYNSIVAGGNNACTLHYVTNDQPLKDGDLVLIDAGAEYNYYAADITRTFPVNKKFTTEQREIYNLVLEAQLAGIEQVKPGNRQDSVHKKILEVLVHGLVKLKILHGDVAQLIKNQEYMKFYMHGSGHWLGLDVHDAGKYKINNEARKFEPGMVLTVEPGIYIAYDTPGVDSKWFGIGVRIEDDVLVTAAGHDVLSKKVPKTIEEIERVALG
jgi:Xaa-Pro aminopeptidase